MKTSSEQKDVASEILESILLEECLSKDKLYPLAKDSIVLALNREVAREALDDICATITASSFVEIGEVNNINDEANEEASFPSTPEGQDREETQPEPVIPPVIELQQVIPPPQFDENYFSRHKWWKVWGRAGPEIGTKGKGPRKVNIPRAPEDTPFKFNGTCALFEHFQMHGLGLCPSMKIQNIEKTTSLICSGCGVYLHNECHPFYHMHLAADRLSNEQFAATYFL